jgi:hypothetical protein
MRCTRPLSPALLALILLAGPAPRAAAEPAKPERYRIPYQLTETKHVLVRVKINGKGPFNMILDTGAPLVFLGKDAAKRAGLEADKNGWGTFDRFEIEGGIKLEKVKGRIEDPFQLVGMNKMNLPGIRYDGILGYTMLARFRIEIDFTDTHLTWTKLDWEPPLPLGLTDLGGQVPAEVAAMGGMVQVASLLVGRRPDAVLIYRGFLGLELEAGAEGLVVSKVLPDSPAAAAGLKAGDRLAGVDGHAVASLADVRRRTAELPAGKEVAVEVIRGAEKLTVTVKTTKGL